LNFAHHQIAEGVDLYLCETDKFATVTVKVFIQDSLALETAAANALIPLVLIQGTKSYPTRVELVQKMENLYGAAFWTDVEKIGERQILEFYFDVAAPHLIPNGRQVLREGLAAFGELITDPLAEGGAFHRDFFHKEQANLAKMVAGIINDKQAYAVWQAVKAMCKGEPYGLYKYGEREQIEKLEPEAVYAHYQELLQSNPIAIFVVGQSLEELPELIGAWPWRRKALKELPPVSVKEEVREQEIIETQDVHQAVLVMGYRTAQRYLSPDYYGLLVANGILGAFPHSKLFVNVREKASLAYYVDSSLEGSKGLLTVTAGIAPQSYGQAVEIIRRQVAELQYGTISDDELNRTKIGLISGIRKMLDDPAAVIDRNLIGLVHKELRSPQMVMERIAAVTKEQVQKAAQGLQLDTVYCLSGPKGEA